MNAIEIQKYLIHLRGKLSFVVAHLILVIQVVVDADNCGQESPVVVCVTVEIRKPLTEHTLVINVNDIWFFFLLPKIGNI